MEHPVHRDSFVRDITSARAVQRTWSGTDLRRITAHLSLTGSSLARLLSVTGAQKEFILASTDGATTVQVVLNVAAVPEGELVFGNGQMVVDWALGTIAHGEQRASVSRMELRFLAALIEAAPHPMSREQLVARLWPTDAQRSIEREKALAVWIFQLRRRLAQIGLPEAIRTVRGVGYLLEV